MSELRLSTVTEPEFGGPHLADSTLGKAGPTGAGHREYLRWVDQYCTSVSVKGREHLESWMGRRSLSPITRATWTPRCLSAMTRKCRTTSTSGPLQITGLSKVKNDFTALVPVPCTGQFPDCPGRRFKDPGLRGRTARQRLQHLHFRKHSRHRQRPRSVPPWCQPAGPAQGSTRRARRIEGPAGAATQRCLICARTGGCSI